MESATLWMGGIESHMDEAFIIEAFKNVGYTALSVKEIFHKSTGERANYCFVDFGDVNITKEVLTRVNNECIPTTDGKKFNLNRSEYGRTSGSGGSIEYSLFVGDLTSEVTNDMLLDFFRPKYPSVRAAKVVKGSKGESMGYGFARFYDEAEFESALIDMQGVKGLGDRPLRVNKAKSKNQQGGVKAAAAGGDPTQMFPGWMQMQMQYMQQMQQYMQQCQQFTQEAANYASNGGGKVRDQSSSYVNNETSSLMNYVEQQHQQMVAKAAEIDEDVNVVDPDPFIDVMALNQDIIDRDDKLFFELEASRWDFSNSVLFATQQRVMKTS